MTLKPFQYQIPSKRMPPPHLAPITPKDQTEEGLTGWVNGLRASDLEERWARALRAKNLKFIFHFQTRIPGRGYKNDIDFVVNDDFKRVAIEVFGPLSHEGEGNMRRDEVRISELNPVLASQGIESIIVVWYWEISTPELATNKVNALFF